MLTLTRSPADALESLATLLLPSFCASADLAKDTGISLTADLYKNQTDVAPAALETALPAE